MTRKRDRREAPPVHRRDERRSPPAPKPQSRPPATPEAAARGGAPREERRRSRAHLRLPQRRSGAEGAAARARPPLRDGGRGRAAQGSDRGARRRDPHHEPRGDLRPQPPRRGPPGPAARGAAARPDRHLRTAAERPRPRPRPDHRPAQCRGDPAHRRGLRGRRARHHRAPFAGTVRRAGQVRLRRPRARGRSRR